MKNNKHCQLELPEIVWVTCGACEGRGFTYKTGSIRTHMCSECEHKGTLAIPTYLCDGARQ